MRKNYFFFKSLLLATVLMLGSANAWGTPTLKFTEDFSGPSYNVSWGGTSAGGVSPDVTDGVLTVANGSSSGDRSAYVNFGSYKVTGSAHLIFDMGITKSGWSGKNNIFYLFPEYTNARYPSTTNSALTINQDANGYITINGEELGTYNGTVLTYDVTLDAVAKTVKVVVYNGVSEIKTFNYATTATGIGAMHLTFNKNYGAFAIDNISLYSLTNPTFTLSEESKTVTVGGSETVGVTGITGEISVVSKNTSVATASYSAGTITIDGVAAGVATLTVTATNDGLSTEKSIEVTVGDVSTTTVTVNYLCGETPIASPLVLSDVAVGSTLTESEVTYDNVIYGVGCRYISPVLSPTLPYTVVEEGVININYTQQNAVESFTLNYKYNDEIIAYEEISTAGLYCGETYESLPYRKYIVKNGALYETTANTAANDYYHEKNISLVANTVVNKSLSLVDLNGGTIVFFKDFDGATGNNANIRASYGSGYDNTQFTSVEDLPAGTYTFMVRAYSRNRGSSVKVGDQQVFTIAEVGNSWQDKTFTDVNVPAAGKLALVKGATSTDPVDIIIAILHSVPVTISSSTGLATLYSDYALDFEHATPAGLKAYTATYTKVGEDESINLNPESTIQAGTGVVLQGAVGTYSIPVIASSSTAKGDLTGSATEDTDVASLSDYYIYGLAVNGEGKAQFTSVASGTIAKGKAFLKINKTSGNPSAAKSIRVIIDGQTTEVTAPEVVETEEPEVLFNMAGIPVGKDFKGYVINQKGEKRLQK